MPSKTHCAVLRTTVSNSGIGHDALIGLQADEIASPDQQAGVGEAEAHDFADRIDDQANHQQHGRRDQRITEQVTFAECHVLPTVILRRGTSLRISQQHRR